jgi:Asp-tRNA(Asn)/Glu-tRNA(Gln) amidotransferase A subunit family amidase
VQRAYEVLAGGAVPARTIGRACRLRGGGWDRVTPAVAAVLDDAAAVLRAGGIAVEEISWWDDELIGAVSVVQQRAAARVHEALFAEHADEYGADVRARVAHALGVTESAERAARDVLARARAAWEAATGEYDVALAPAAGAEAPFAPVPAAFRDETLPLAAPASGFGLPVAAVPVGFGPAGMPLGMQIIAMRDVAAAFEVGRRFQAATDWHARRPRLEQRIV